MKNYIEYFLPGGDLEVKDGKGNSTGSTITKSNLRNSYEYLKLLVDFIKELYDLDRKLKKANPDYTPDHPASHKWDLYEYILHIINTGRTPAYNLHRGNNGNLVSSFV